MKELTLICIAILTSLLTSCSSNAERSLSAPIFSDTIERSEEWQSIELEAQFRRSMKLDNIIDTTKVVFINTTDETLIANISDIEFFGDRIYILDTNLDQVVVIDTLGQTQFIISDKGRSRREYVDLDGMECDTIAQRLYLLDGNGSKVMVYDMDGELQGVRMLPRRLIKTFAHLGNEVFALEYGCRGSAPKGQQRASNLVIYDTKESRVVGEHLKFRSNDVIFYPRLQNMFYQDGNKTYMWLNLEHSIYELTSQGDMRQRIEFDFGGGGRIPYELFRCKSRDFYEKYGKRNYSQVETFAMYEDFYHICIKTKYNYYHHFYNRHSGEVVQCTQNYRFGDFPKSMTQRLFKVSPKKMCGYISAEQYLKINKLDTIVKIDHNPILLIHELKDSQEW